VWRAGGVEDVENRRDFVPKANSPDSRRGSPRNSLHRQLPFGAPLCHARPALTSGAFQPRRKHVICSVSLSLRPVPVHWLTRSSPAAPRQVGKAGQIQRAIIPQHRSPNHDARESARYGASANTRSRIVLVADLISKSPSPRQPPDAQSLHPPTHASVNRSTLSPP